MSAKPLLLVIDDEDALRSHLSEILENDFEVVCADSAREGLELIKKHAFDAILVDVVMPEKNGISFCKELRGQLGKAEIPILMISALNEPETRILSFEAGADDYIAKPFRPDELCTRIHSRLRRVRHLSAKVETANVIQAGRLRLDLDRVEARVDDERLPLGPVEFKILSLLARKLGQMRSRDEIEEFVWGDRKPASRALDPHINAIRKKINNAALELRTIYGSGYALRVKEERQP